MESVSEEHVDHVRELLVRQMERIDTELEGLTQSGMFVFDRVLDTTRLLLDVADRITERDRIAMLKERKSRKKRQTVRFKLAPLDGKAIVESTLDFWKTNPPATRDTAGDSTGTHVERA